ncbi:MAG TPA: hypothetical protein VE198_05365 [Actinoallomurus sp.]|nr:hypothetical protein [Actinoallomurus sp.]
MSEAASRAVLRPSRSVRRVISVSALAGVAVSGLYAAMVLMSHGLRLLIPVLIVAAVLAGRPLLVLCGRTLLGADRITVRRAPIGRMIVPISHVGLVEIRRGLLMEWPVLYLRDGRLIELAAPMRFWFRADPVYERELDELRARVRHPVAGIHHQWSLLRLVAGPLLTATALILILIDPPWASDVWPLRPHADHLPDACTMLDAKARRLLPGAQVDHMFSRNDDSDAHVKRHTCQWNATRLSPDGATLVDVGRLSIVVELDHGIGPTSDAEEAHRAFVRATHIDIGGNETRLPHVGDEADLIVEHPGSGFAWVAVAVRKANVAEKIDLIYRGRAREREAAQAAMGLAKLGISKIEFS